MGAKRAFTSLVAALKNLRGGGGIQRAKGLAEERQMQRAVMFIRGLLHRYCVWLGESGMLDHRTSYRMPDRVVQRHRSTLIWRTIDEHVRS